MKKHIPAIVLGIVLGLAVQLSAQSPPKITATGGFNLCTDWAVSTLAAGQALVLQLSIDGATAMIPAGVTWTGSASPFASNIPISQFPASARTVGVHTFDLYAQGGASIILADGTVLNAVPATPLRGSYEIVVPPVGGVTPTNPRWIKIAGTIAAILIGWWVWRANG